MTYAAWSDLTAATGTSATSRQLVGHPEQVRGSVRRGSAPVISRARPRRRACRRCRSAGGRGRAAGTPRPPSSRASSATTRSARARQRDRRRRPRRPRRARCSSRASRFAARVQLRVGQRLGPRRPARPRPGCARACRSNAAGQVTSSVSRGAVPSSRTRAMSGTSSTSDSRLAGAAMIASSIASTPASVRGQLRRPAHRRVRVEVQLERSVVVLEHVHRKVGRRTRPHLVQVGGGRLAEHHAGPVADDVDRGSVQPRDPFRHAELAREVLPTEPAVRHHVPHLGRDGVEQLAERLAPGHAQRQDVRHRVLGAMTNVLPARAPARDARRAARRRRGRGVGRGGARPVPWGGPRARARRAGRGRGAARPTVNVVGTGPAWCSARRPPPT